MKKSLIIGMASIAIIGASLIGTSIYAAPSGNMSSGLSLHQNGEYGNKGGRGMGGIGQFTQMTDAEKTAFEAMSPTEKQAYITTKGAEAEARRNTHEVILDKLLAGTALSTDEEKIRQEIITQRAEMKAKRLEMEVNREKIQLIREKQKAGTTLTAEEQALLGSMPKMGGHRGIGGPMRK